MDSTNKTRKKTTQRGVAPVIATLLLVAIAVVGGSIVFVFSQGFFSSAQVSGSPTIESLKILGYDARDAQELVVHSGDSTGGVQGTASDGLNAEERIAVYVQNSGVSKATFSEVRFAGSVYSYNATSGTTSLNDAGAAGPLQAGGYVIVTDSDGTTSTIIDSSAPELQPGQQATIVLELDENVKTGRDAQIKLTTTNGAVFVGTVVAGQQSG